MRKIANEVVRFNARLPKVVADWLGSRAKSHGITLSEELRHLIIEAKTADDIIKNSASTINVNCPSEIK
jgi:hypothetical protein